MGDCINCGRPCFFDDPRCQACGYGAEVHYHVPARDNSALIAEVYEPPPPLQAPRTKEKK